MSDFRDSCRFGKDRHPHLRPSELACTASLRVAWRRRRMRAQLPLLSCAGLLTRTPASRPILTRVTTSRRQTRHARRWKSLCGRCSSSNY